MPSVESEILELLAPQEEASADEELAAGLAELADAVERSGHGLRVDRIRAEGRRYRIRALKRGLSKPR